jgi:ABC-type nitrate/sulfonate/bicarbonate transport system permease component
MPSSKGWPVTLREQVSGPAPVVEAAEPAAKLPLRQRAWFQRTLVWGGLVVASQLFAMQAGPFFWPSIPDIVSGAVESVSDGTYVMVLSSFAQMFAGFGLAVVVGVPLGLLMGQFKVIDFVLGPFVNALFVTSLVALLPFIILVCGTDFAFRVAVVFLFAVFYLIITPAAGVRAIDRDINEMGTSFGISAQRRLLSITLPGTLPYIITGLRLGIGQAVQGMVVAELWVTLGTGRRLMNLGYARELGQFFATAAAVVVIGAAMTGLLLFIQKRLTPWADDVESAVSGAR